MEGVNRLPVTLLIFSWILGSCTGLFCFECSNVNTDDNTYDRCGDHFALPNTASKYCQGTCLKRRGERYSNAVRIVEVYRTCVEQRGDGCFSETWNGISVNSCACNNDYCNTGAHTHSAPVHFVGLVVLAVSVVFAGRWNL